METTEKTGKTITKSKIKFKINLLQEKLDYYTEYIKIIENNRKKAANTAVIATIVDMFLIMLVMFVNKDNYNMIAILSMLSITTSMCVCIYLVYYNIKQLKIETIQILKDKMQVQDDLIKLQEEYKNILDSIIKS